MKLLRSLGARVYTLGTTRRTSDYQGTMQSPGLPDVLAFLPARGECRPRLLVVEVKAPRGRASDEQKEFQRLCLLSGVHHVLGGVDTVIRYLIDETYLRADQVAHYHTEPPRC